MTLVKLINKLITSGLIKAAPVNLTERIIHYSLHKDPGFIKSEVEHGASTKRIIIVLNLEVFKFARFVTGALISKIVRKTLYLIDQLGYHISMFDEGNGMVNFTESRFVKVVGNYEGKLTLVIEKGRIKYHYLFGKVSKI